MVSAFGEVSCWVFGFQVCYSLTAGDETWPPACCFKYVAGDQFTHLDRVMVDALQPGAVTDVSVEMKSPERTGIYQGQWRMCTATGMYFGGTRMNVYWNDQARMLKVFFHGFFGWDTSHIISLSSNFNYFMWEVLLEDLEIDGVNHVNG